MRIIDADASAIPAITAIYNDAVEHTTAIWNDRLVDEADRAAWLADKQHAGLPVLVAVADPDDGVTGKGPGEGVGEVLGYATYGPWRPHDGYRATVEHSVYVASAARGGGIGTALLLALIERARAAGMHVMVAGIDGENQGSIRLHERLGFDTVGTLPQVGMKFGRWLDLVFCQLTLDDRPRPSHQG
ncbi:GNAT family N-acetyltransferase [Brachybacterium huguangmaarense]